MDDLEAPSDAFGRHKYNIHGRSCSCIAARIFLRFRCLRRLLATRGKIEVSTACLFRYEFATGQHSITNTPLATRDGAA